MRKDYSTWHALEVRLQDIPLGNIPQFHERDTWWCSLGTNIGDEEDGKNTFLERPIIVVKKFNRNLFLGLPLTTRIKEGKFYYSLTVGGRESSVILSQVRILDGRRLQRRIGEVSVNQLAEIRRNFKKLISE